MIPDITLQVRDTLTPALMRLLASRESQRSMAEGMDETMQYWVSFVMAKQTVASKPGIRDYLMALADRKKGGAPVRKRTASGRESTAARYLALRDSRAAAIVWNRNYQGARDMAPAEFFSLVGKYVARRQYSAGYHKSGFRPALDAFKARRGLLAGAPSYKKEVSSAFPAHLVSDSILEALAINATAGVDQNPTGGEAAVEESKAEVIAQFEAWTKRNLTERAAALGI